MNPKLLMLDTRAIIPSWWILLIDPQKQLFCQVLQCKDFFLFLRHKCTLLWLRIVEKNQNLPRNMIRHQFDITNIVQQWESCGQLWLEMTKTQSLSKASFRSTASKLLIFLARVSSVIEILDFFGSGLLDLKVSRSQTCPPLVLKTWEVFRSVWTMLHFKFLLRLFYFLPVKLQIRTGLGSKISRRLLQLPL